MEGMQERELPPWAGAASAASVRLAAEAGADADELLADPGTSRSSAMRMAQHVARLEQSADLTEVAADLATLLWAECEEVPRISTIVEEPSAQAALEAVAEARREAARRLATRLASSAGGEVKPPERSLDAAGIRLILKQASAAPAGEGPSQAN
jgi:hypothetical protein